MDLYRTNDSNKVSHLEREIAKYFRDMTAYILGSGKSQVP